MNWDDIIIDAAATDTGMRRANNQDSHTVVRASHARPGVSAATSSWSPTAWARHAVGELASKMACDNIPHNYMKAEPARRPRRSPRRTVKSAR